MTTPEQEPTYSLVVPFVVCTSQGGPYEDDAFAAGYSCGSLSAAMTGRPKVIGPVPIRSDTVRQIDLLAMHYGYTMEAEPWGAAPEEWTFVTLRLVVAP